MRPKLQVVAVFAFALVARVAWALLTRDSIPISDAAWYVEAARNLAATGEYSQDGALTAYWPVGYPFFLSLFHHGWTHPLAMAEAVQILLSSLSCCLVALVALRAGAARWASVAAGLVFAAFPSALSLSTVFLSETLFTFLLLAGFWCGTFRRPVASALLSGSFLASACYVRPVAVLLIPLVFLPELLSGKSGRSFRRYVLGTSGILLVVALAAVPWGLRNQRVFGSFVAFSTNGGVNLYIGHNPQATGGYVETPEMGALDTVRNEAERSRQLKHLATQYMVGNPARETALFFRKLALLLVPEREPVYFSFITDPADRDFPRLAYLAAGANNLLWLGLFGAFLLVPWWNPRRSGGMGFAAALAFWFQVLFYCLFFVTERYKFPAIPFLLIALAATGFRPAWMRARISVENRSAV